MRKARGYEIWWYYRKQSIYTKIHKDSTFSTCAAEEVTAPIGKVVTEDRRQRCETDDIWRGFVMQ
jgi:hypothetical protein